MMIRTSIEPRRGCGYRKKGGKYLIGGKGPSHACAKLPIPLTVCPCCSQGIKFSRGVTWITFEVWKSAPCHLVGNIEYERKGIVGCGLCPMVIIERMLLLWVGEKSYPDTRTFDLEAMRLGISRRTAQIPRGLQVGDWIALAHRKAISVPVVGEKGELSYAFKPGIFHLFKLQSIEYVITGNETPTELEEIEKKGLSLVKVIPDTEAQQSCL